MAPDLRSRATLTTTNTPIKEARPHGYTKTYTQTGEPPMSNVNAASRVVLGRNITLTAGAVYALSRALSYATMSPDTMNQAQAAITLDGRIAWAWAAIWAMCAVFCIADMVNRHTRYGLSAVVGVALGWGVANVIVWAFDPEHDPSLISAAIGWITPAGLVLGFLLKVTALQDMLRTLRPPGDARD